MIRNLLIGALVFLAILVLGIALMSCSDEEGHWVVVDTVHAPVDSIVLPDAIASTDTLRVTFICEDSWKELYDADNLGFSHFEIDLNEGNMVCIVWGDLKNWEGNSTMPPCGGCGFTQEAVELTPFEEGDLRILVQQPDDTILEETVQVLP